MKMFFIFLALTSWITTSYAQDDQVTVKYDGVSQTATSAAEAVKIVSSEATETTARNQVIELIGEAKYNKFKEKIDKRIISQASKFIPYIHPSQAVAVSGGGYKVSVEMKVSTGSLKELVQKAGLLADTETPGTLISLVSFTNKSNGLSLKWWEQSSLEGKADLTLLNSIWQQTISAELEKKKFQVLRSTAIPTQMVIRGEGRIGRADDGSGTLAIKAGVYQSSDSRLIADVTRNTKLPRLTEATLKLAASQLFSEVSKELTGAVHEAWQGGVIGSTAVQIAANGSLTPKQVEDFKTELNRTVRELKNLRERKFSTGRVVLEADFKGSLTALTERLRQAQLPSFQTEVEGLQGSEVALRVKARR